MGLTGRTQKRLKRYRDQYLNIFRQINAEFNLQLREDEFYNAANELAWVKVKNKKWEQKFWRNPFTWFQGVLGAIFHSPKYSSTARVLEGVRRQILNEFKSDFETYLESFENNYNLVASLTQVAQVAKTEKIHAGSENYQPTQSGVDALLNSRGGKAAAGGHKFRHKAYPQNSTQATEKLFCQAKLNIHFKRVCAGFERLNEVGYAAGNTFLQDFKNSIKRNSYSEIYRIEQLTTQENIHNYRRDLRCKIARAYRQEFYHQLDKNNSFDSVIKLEDFTNDKISGVLGDTNLTLEAKKEHYYYYCLSFLQAFFGELLDEEDKTIRLVSYEVAVIDQINKKYKNFLEQHGLAWVIKEEQLDSAVVSAAVWQIKDYIEVDDLPRERAVAVAKEVAKIAANFAFVRTIRSYVNTHRPPTEPDLVFYKPPNWNWDNWLEQLNRNHAYSALFEFDGRQVGAIFSPECEFSWKKWELNEILKFDF